MVSSKLMNYPSLYKSKMFSKAKRLRQIAIDEKNYELLRTLGHTPESFNDIITRVLEQNERLSKMKMVQM